MKRSFVLVVLHTYGHCGVYHLHPLKLVEYFNDSFIKTMAKMKNRSAHKSSSSTKVQPLTEDECTAARHATSPAG